MLLLSKDSQHLTSLYVRGGWVGQSICGFEILFWLPHSTPGGAIPLAAVPSDRLTYFLRVISLPLSGIFIVCFCLFCSLHGLQVNHLSVGVYRETQASLMVWKKLGCSDGSEAPGFPVRDLRWSSAVKLLIILHYCILCLDGHRCPY